MADPSTTPAAVGVDVGGTNLRMALVGEAGMVLEQRRVTSPQSADGFLQAVLDVHGDLTASLDDPGLPLGLGVAALVRDRRVAVQGPNVPITELDLVEELGARGLRHVVVENDATAAMYGEWQAGAARGHDDVLMVTVGTGVGGGAIVGGRLLQGAHGFGGEAGHTSLQVEGRPCPCGRRGCLEAYASGSAIAQTAREVLEESPAPSQLRDAVQLDGAAVGEAAEAGDLVALEVLARTGRWLGVGIVGMVNLLDPSLVVVGGGVTERVGGYFLPHVEAALRDELECAVFRPTPQLATAELGDDAGMVGAALLALHTVGEDRGDG